MGQEPAEQLTAEQTVAEIEATRQRLSRDIDVLTTRLPDSEAATRAAAISAGATVAAVGSLWFGWSRYQRAKDRNQLAALLHDAGVDARGPRPSSGGGIWKVLLGFTAGTAIGAAGYVATRGTLADGHQEPEWTELT